MNNRNNNNVGRKNKLLSLQLDVDNPIDDETLNKLSICYDQK